MHSEVVMCKASKRWSRLYADAGLLAPLAECARLVLRDVMRGGEI